MLRCCGGSVCIAQHAGRAPGATERWGAIPAAIFCTCRFSSPRPASHAFPALQEGTLHNKRASGAKVLTLTGWVALVAMFCLATLTLGGIVYGIRRWSGHRCVGVGGRWVWVPGQGAPGGGACCFISGRHRMRYGVGCMVAVYSWGCGGVRRVHASCSGDA